MSRIPGTIPLSGVIAPSDDADTYPVTEDIYNKGGHRSVNTLVDRDSIPHDRRKNGMLVYVESTSLTYQLIGNIWEIFAGSSGAGDLNYTHIQGVASTLWNIAHNLGKYPSVTVLDSALNEVVGEVVYIDFNNVQVTFSAIFSGTATLN